jgi:hypothetical protein
MTASMALGRGAEYTRSSASMNRKLGRFGASVVVAMMEVVWSCLVTSISQSMIVSMKSQLQQQVQVELVNGGIMLVMKERDSR